MMEHDEARVLGAVDAALPGVIAEIQAAIRIPGVSKTGEGLAEMADWTEAALARTGAAVTRHPGRIAPILEGHVAGGPGELLFYSLYDVQPATPEGWTSPPFEARLVDTPAGRHLIGRGAFNSKGPLVAFLGAVALFRALGVPLPVGIRFVIEGEEEIGSPSLPGFIRAHRDRLGAADGVLIPYLATTSAGETPLRLGFKGLGFLEFTVEGGAWGGPAHHDIHAMHAAWIGSPGWELLSALASLQDREGRLTIDGLPDAAWWTPEDDALVARAAARIDAAATLRDLGAERFFRDGDMAAQLRRLLMTPTLNLDGIWVGQTPPGRMPATQVAHAARAVMDIRFVPGQDPEAVVAAIRAHLDGRGFAHVKMTASGLYPGSRSRPADAVVAALVAACEAHGRDVTMLPIHAGAAPLYLFSEVLGVPYAFGGLGHGGRSHAPDEYLDVASMGAYMKSMVSLLYRFAEKLR